MWGVYGNYFMNYTLVKCWAIKELRQEDHGPGQVRTHAIRHNVNLSGGHSCASTIVAQPELLNPVGDLLQDSRCIVLKT